MKKSMVDNLESMLATGRDDAMLRFGLGSAYFNDKDFDSAIRHLEACLEHDGGYSAAYKLLGKAHLQKGDQADAIRVFETGLPIAVSAGDKQSQKEMEVFLAKAKKQSGNEDQ